MIKDMLFYSRPVPTSQSICPLILLTVISESLPLSFGLNNFELDGERGKRVNVHIRSFYKEMERFQMISKGFKYLLRGIVFLFYFPIHFFLICFNWFYEYIIKRLSRWLWRRWIRPVASWMITYLILIPLDWIYQHVIKPVGLFLWKYVIQQILWPLIRYGLLVPLVWISYYLWKTIQGCWNYLIWIPARWVWRRVIQPLSLWCWQRFIHPVARWFWEEILQVVIRWAVIVTNWIFRLLGWIFLNLFWFPLKWLWGMVKPALHWIVKNAIIKPSQWVNTHFIHPTLQWLQSVFDSPTKHSK